MPTMKDIAKRAGVSHGTVSNVLNNRGNVSVEKIKLVRDAANALGYSVNLHAQQLRKYQVLNDIVAVIVPNIKETKYQVLFTAIHQYFYKQKYQVQLHTTDESPYLEKKAMEKIVTYRPKIAMVITSFTSSIDAYNVFNDIGITTLFIERIPRTSNETAHYIGYDYYQGGKQLAAQTLHSPLNHVAIFTGLPFYRHEKDFIKGVEESIHKQQREVEINLFHASCDYALLSAFDMLAGPTQPDIIFCSNNNLSQALQHAANILLKSKKPQILTINQSKTNYLTTSRDYQLDYFSLGYIGAEKIYTEIIEVDPLSPAGTKDRDENIFHIHKPQGFHFARKLTISKPTTLHLLFPESGATDAIRRMAPAFTKETNIKLDFTIRSLSLLTDNLAMDPYLRGFDVIRTNVTTTQGFPPNALTPLPADLFQKLTATMLRQPVKHFSYIDDRPCVVPFDYSMFFQIYHKQFFEDDMLKRQFYEKYHRHLKVPTTFEAYNQVSQFFTRSFQPGSPVKYGTTAVITENTTIVYDFYKRYLHFGGVILDDENNFVFNENIAVQALESFLEMMKYALISTNNRRKDLPTKHLLAGKTALEMISTSHVAPIINIQKNRMRGLLGFAPMPDPFARMGGGSLAIPMNSAKKEAALEFVAWACGEEQSVLFTSLGGLSPHKKAFLNLDLNELYPWLPVVYHAANAKDSINDLSVVNRYQFEKLVGMTLKNSYGHAITPLEAARLLKTQIKSTLL